MNALLSVIITSQIFLFRMKIQSFQIDEFVKSCSIIYICLTTQPLYQKNKFYTCSLLFKANFYVAHALLAQIFSNFFYSWYHLKQVKKSYLMSILVFPSEIFLELSNFLMLKTQLCQKAPFHATTVDISLIELCGLQISKNWLFSVVVK